MTCSAGQLSCVDRFLQPIEPARGYLRFGGILLDK